MLFEVGFPLLQESRNYVKTLNNCSVQREDPVSSRIEPILCRKFKSAFKLILVNSMPKFAKSTLTLDKEDSLTQSMLENLRPIGAMGFALERAPCLNGGFPLCGVSTKESAKERKIGEWLALAACVNLRSHQARGLRLNLRSAQSCAVDHLVDGWPSAEQLCTCTSLKTLSSLNKEVRPVFLGDNSIWNLTGVSSLSDYSIWRF